MSDVTWPQAGGKQTIHSITVNGEIFVRHDHDAYATGYSACKDDVKRMLRKQCQCGHDAGSHCYCDALVSELIPDIDALPPKEEL